MKSYFVKAVVSGILATCVFTLSGYAQGSPTYDNLTVTQRAAVASSIDANYYLSVISPTGIYGAGKASIFAYRGGSPGSGNGGTGWTWNGVDAAVKGFSYWGNVFSAGVAAFSELDYNNSAALVAASFDGTTNTKLAFKDGTGIVWPGYFSTPGANALQYGIALRNPNGTDAGGTATGILFGVDALGEFGKGAIIYERKNAYARGSICFLQEQNATATNPGLANKVMTITNAGVVGIGVEPSPTSTNKLEVQGNTAITGTGTITGTLSVGSTISAGSTITVTNGDLVLANGKVTVKNWSLEAPDYVFDRNYAMPKIADVEKYVKKNRHLPDMPSATEMKKNGVDLTEMNMRLLKKVEELTLWAIEQDKKIDEQNKKIELLVKTANINK